MEVESQTDAKYIYKQYDVTGTRSLQRKTAKRHS